MALAAPKASPQLLSCIHELAAKTKELLGSAELSRGVKDLRLSLEVGAIERLARKLVHILQERDPLSETVHLSKPAFVSTLIAAVFLGLGRRLFAPRLALDSGVGEAMITQAVEIADSRGKRCRARPWQLVLRGHAHHASRPARGDVRDLLGSPAVRSTTSPTTRVRQKHAWPSWSCGGAISTRFISAKDAPISPASQRPCETSNSKRRTSAPSSTAWRWMSGKTSRRLLLWIRSLLRSCCQRRWTAVVARVPPVARRGQATRRAPRSRLAADQHPARPRRGRCDGPAYIRPSSSPRPGSAAPIRLPFSRIPRCRRFARG